MRGTCLSELAYRKTVIVITGKTDRYGRVVGKVLADGQDVNLEQVRRGMAWHYKAYEREQSAIDRVSYAAEEDAARNLKRGLWSMPGAQPPWEFRRHGAADPAGSRGTPWSWSSEFFQSKAPRRETTLL